MSAATWLVDGLLIALTLAMAALSLFHRRIFAGALLFIVYGLMLALVWLRLGAPDVALAEAAIGAGLTGALLIGTLSRLAAAARARTGAARGGEAEGEPGD